MATTAIAARRRSVSATAAPPEVVDALFVFDAPQRFVDLARPPPPLASVGGTLPPHDAWFDRAHEAHSRPSAELAQAEHKALTLALGASNSTNSRNNSSSNAPLNAGAAQEKENRAAGPPPRRGNVGAPPPPPTEATSVGSQQPMSMAVSGSASGAGAESQPSAGVEVAPAVVERTRAPIKTTTAVVIGKKRVVVTRETVATTKRSGASAAATKTSALRERGPSAAPPSSVRGNARFMAPTASSRLAAAAKQSADAQRAVAARSAKAKTTTRRATPAGSGAVNDDFQDLQELLARHNKKFKATHTYQPPQHSVRDVRMWEKSTHQSYYDLSPEDRVAANSEIAALVRKAREGSSSSA